MSRISGQSTTGAAFGRLPGMQGGNLMSVPPEDRVWPGAVAEGQPQMRRPAQQSTEDVGYSGGETDAEPEASTRVANWAPVHRRSMSNPEAADENRWRGKDAQQRLQHGQPGKPAVVRSTNVSPRSTFSDTIPGSSHAAEAGGQSQLQADGAEAGHKSGKRGGFFRRRRSKQKEPEPPAAPSLERSNSATLKSGSRWGWIGLAPGGKQATDSDGAEAASATVDLTARGGGQRELGAEQPSSQRQSFEGTEGSSTESGDGHAEHAGAKAAAVDREVNKAGDKKSSKPSHRRQSSLGSLSQLLTIRGRGRSLDDEAAAPAGDGQVPDPSPPHTPKSQAGARQEAAQQSAAGGTSAASVTAKVPPPIRPKTPDLPAPSKPAASSTLASCFGLGSNRQGSRSFGPSPEQSGVVGEDMDDIEEVVASNIRPMLPAGMVGLRNLGNTCFMNAALQCLRFTPELPLLLIPDILDSLPVPGSPAAIAVTTEHPPLSQLAADTLSSPQEASPTRPSSAGSSVGRAPLGGGVVMEDGDVTSAMLGTSHSASPRGVVQCSPNSMHGTVSQASTRRSEDAQPLANGAVSPAHQPASPKAKEISLSPDTAPPVAQLGVPLPSGPDTVDYQQNATAQQPLQSSAPPSASAFAALAQAAPLTETGNSLPSVPSVTTAAHSGLLDHVPPHLPATSTVLDAAMNSTLAPAPDGNGHAIAANGPEAANDAVDAPPSASGQEQQHQQQPQQQQQRQHSLQAPLRAMAAAAKGRPKQKGDISEAFRNFLREVFLGTAGAVADPTALLQSFSQEERASDFFDGGQHDCEEVLRTLLHALHDDMNRAKPKPQQQPASQPGGEHQDPGKGDKEKQPAEHPKREKGKDCEDATRAECAKADLAWAEYLSTDDSPITDLFCGQMQSSVTCQKCNGRFTRYEPFWDLSLPVAKEKLGGIGNWLSSKTNPASITDCLAAFAADEVMQGAEAFSCEVCNERTTAVKRMRVHRMPRCLLLHIKRFRYNGVAREKLSAMVTYPLKGLKLGPYLSDDAAAAQADDTAYNLYAVSNHFGNLVGGHYTTFCKANTDVPGRRQWLQLNDEAVLRVVHKDQLVTPNAYMLFYCRKGA